jgi:hypothetical protein
VHLRRRQQLVAEVVGELGVDAPVHPAPHLLGRDLQVVLLEGHARRLHRQLARVLLGVPLAVVGQAAGDDEDRPLKPRNPQVAGAESDHGPVLSIGRALSRPSARAASGGGVQRDLIGRSITGLSPPSSDVIWYPVGSSESASAFAGRGGVMAAPIGRGAPAS